MIYVIDIAVRKDKRVECDTVFTETKPSEELCKDIADKLDAEVIICAVGRFIPFNREKQKELSFKVLKEVEHGE